MCESTEMPGGSKSRKVVKFENEVKSILETCEEQNMTADDIIKAFSPLRQHFESISDVEVESWKEKFSRKVVIILAALLIGWAVFDTMNARLEDLKFHALAIFRIAMIKILPYWNWTDLYYKPCLIRNPFFEGPRLNVDDCNICETTETIDSLSNVSQVEVNDQYVKRQQPFIVTDAMDEWEVMKTDQFWFDNVTEQFLRHDELEVCNINSNFRVQYGGLARIFSKIYNPATQHWFLHWVNCQKEGAKIARQFYKRPYFISNSLDFTGPNWILMSSDFKGRIYKKIDTGESVVMMYQIRGQNRIRLSPKTICDGICPELSDTLREGEILVVITSLWQLEYIPKENGDNFAIISEAAWSSIE